MVEEEQVKSRSLAALGTTEKEQVPRYAPFDFAQGKRDDMDDKKARVRSHGPRDDREL
jgi:hypothetical protein